MDKPTLRAFLEAERVSQADIVRGTGLSSGYVSLLVNERTGANQDTINSILAFLAAFLRRPVTYEECFGSPLPVEAPETAPAETAPAETAR